MALFWRIVAVAFVVKLALTSAISIAPFYAPHDESNFVEHARFIAAGRWLGPYDSLTLIKGPFFPIYLALIREFGISLPIAHHVTYALACVLACFAVRPLANDARVLGAMFVALFFNPFTFDGIADLANRSQIAGTLALATIACAAALFVRRGAPARALWRWVLALGFAFTAFELTREDGVWLLPPLALLLVPFVLRARREPPRFAFERIALTVLPFAMLWSASAAIASANGATYGWKTVVELDAAEFRAAYGALARIGNPRTTRRIPVPRSALALAYEVSPAARSLRPALDGAVGANWRTESCDATGICDEIAGGWFVWALRQAADVAGHARSGPDARAFYLQLAREIDAACDARRIACGPRRDTLVPQLTLADVRPIAATLARLGLRLVTLYDGGVFARPNAPGDGGLEADYRFVTGSPYVPPGRRAFAGWLVAPNATSIVAYDGAMPDAEAHVDFTPSADVAAAMLGSKRAATWAAQARFQLLTPCVRQCSLHVTDVGHAVTIVPLDAARPDFANAHVTYHLERIDERASAASDRAKSTILGAIFVAYQRFGCWLIVASVVVLAIDAIGCVRRRTAPGGDRTAIGAALLLGTCTYAGVLAIVATVSFPTANPEYESVVYPVLLFFGTFTLGARFVHDAAPLRPS